MVTSNARKAGKSDCSVNPRGLLEPCTSRDACTVLRDGDAVIASPRPDTPPQGHGRLLRCGYRRHPIGSHSENGQWLSHRTELTHHPVERIGDGLVSADRRAHRGTRAIALKGGVRGLRRSPVNAVVDDEEIHQHDAAPSYRVRPVVALSLPGPSPGSRSSVLPRGHALVYVSKFSRECGGCTRSIFGRTTPLTETRNFGLRPRWKTTVRVYVPSVLTGGGSCF